MKSVIFGMSGASLTETEKDFFNKCNPCGFILFKRNCIYPLQVQTLIKELKICTGNDNLYILIDQEGGRVSRLKHPNFKEYPSALSFSASNMKLDESIVAVYHSYFAMGQELLNLGINTNCAPVCDLLYNNLDINLIGDRSFGSSVDNVVKLTSSAIHGLIDANITPVIKHIPGHGRATVDSHHYLPIINEKYEILMDTDFAVFKELSTIKFSKPILAMTAHIIFSDIDKDEPVTFSKKMINIIKNQIGFSGLIITDDISMNALVGEIDQRAEKSLESGCDIVLHCNGNIKEMKKIAKVL